MRSAIKKFWEYIGRVNGLLLILYSVFVLSTAVFLSGGFSLTYALDYFFPILITAVIVCPFIIRFLAHRSIKTLGQTGVIRHAAVWRAAMFAIPFAVLLLYYAAYYPGGFSDDTITQLSQAAENRYVDWHPVIQTLLAI